MLQQFIKHTLTDHQTLEPEIETVKQQSYTFDDEEFLPGLMPCSAVLSSQQRFQHWCGHAHSSNRFLKSHDEQLKCDDPPTPNNSSGFSL
ncbi:IclR family transcriptional regulator domain-containing protein [Nitrosomonas eutropha]|uniref:IclR family transcriptional regulator domain-containing protein n=1 Tax=Nitrosomonas eutropha TaxID=916 RepID=UPI000941F9F4